MVKPYENILSEILLFIADEVPRPRLCQLTENTDLRKDLRMDNEDAYELMKKYFHKFNVIDKNFNFEKYFPEEGDGIIGAFLLGMLNRNRSIPEAKPLTISMLAHAVSTGIWNETISQKD